HRGGKRIVVMPLKFSKGWFNLSVACNANGTIEFGLHPGPAPGASTEKVPASLTAWVAAAGVGAKTLPITIPRDGFQLRGVLDLPAGKGPFGVVSIIPGSGPVDINGNAAALQYSMYKK